MPANIQRLFSHRSSLSKIGQKKQRKSTQKGASSLQVGILQRTHDHQVLVEIAVFLRLASSTFLKRKSVQEDSAQKLLCPEVVQKLSRTSF